MNNPFIPRILQIDRKPKTASERKIDRKIYTVFAVSAVLGVIVGGVVIYLLYQM